MEKVSFIIPAHNAQHTIERAVQSIVSLNLNSEIIIVENGSTDKTLDAAEKLKEQYSSIHIFCSGKGVSKARNMGLEQAQGEWIMFLDADDYYLPEFELVFKRFIDRHEYDMCLFGHFSGKELRLVTDRNYVDTNVGAVRINMLNNPTKYMQVWAKLFKASIIKDHNIRFNEQLVLSEDSDFTLRYTRYCKTFFFSNQAIYHYSIDNVSTMRGNSDKIELYIQAMKETKKSIADETPNIKYAFNKYVLTHFNIAMVRDVFARNRSEYSDWEKWKVLKSTSKRRVFREAMKSIKLSECTALRMLPIAFIKIKCYGGAFLIYSIRAKQNAMKSAIAD